jgi:hemerythrin-like domain-containing protein
MTSNFYFSSIYHDYEQKIQAMDVENNKLRALSRKHEMKIETLENDLEQKHKENSQLSALCDDLIKGGPIKSN